MFLIISSKVTEKQYAKDSKYVNKDIVYRDAYPCLLKKVVVCSEGETYVDGNRGMVKK